MFLLQIRNLSLSLAMLFLLIAGCQKEGGGGSTGSDEKSLDAAAFGGLWQTSCVKDFKQAKFNSFDQAEFKGNEFINSFSLFTDDACSKLVSTRRQIGSFSLTPNSNKNIKNAPDKININLERIELTIYSQAMVNIYNEVEYCGGDWQRKTPKIISQKLCQDSFEESTSSIFDILKIETIEGVETLFFGEKNDTLSNATSESKRPSTLNLARPYLKVEE